MIDTILLGLLVLMEGGRLYYAWSHDRHVKLSLEV